MIKGGEGFEKTQRIIANVEKDDCCCSGEPKMAKHLSTATIPLC